MAVTEYLPELGLEELKDWKKTIKCLIAELIGVLFLVLVGCGACIQHTEGEKMINTADIVRIALAFGVTVATMAQSIGHVSGCHINPAVTAGLLVGRKIGLLRALFYIVFQCLGGVIGAGLLLILTPTEFQGAAGLGKTALAAGVSPGQGFGIELLITFVLVLVVYGAAADEHNAPSVKGSAPLAIGLSITTCHLFAVPFTGSSMNPARTFGPAAILGDFANHWVYWLGPILGGVLAAIVYLLVLKAEAPESPKTEEYKSVPTKEENAA